MTNSQYSFDIDPSNFEQIVLKGDPNTPILVAFWAPRDEASETLMPILARLADEYQGRFILAKINAQEQQAIAGQFGIRSIPTAKMVKNGGLADEFTGAISEQEARDFLAKHVPAEAADPLQTQVDGLIEQGQASAALELLEASHIDAIEKPQLTLTHAKLLTASGDIEKAELKLASLAEEEQEKVEVKGLRARFYFARLIPEIPSPEELQQRLTENPKDSEAGYQLAAHNVMVNQLESALDLLLNIMRYDRKYEDDGARKAMLLIFNILGADNPLTGQYRNRIFNLLH